MFDKMYIFSYKAKRNTLQEHISEFDIQTLWESKMLIFTKTTGYFENFLQQIRNVQNTISAHSESIASVAGTKRNCFSLQHF